MADRLESISNQAWGMTQYTYTTDQLVKVAELLKSNRSISRALQVALDLKIIPSSLEYAVFWVSMMERMGKVADGQEDLAFPKEIADQIEKILCK